MPKGLIPFARLRSLLTDITYIITNITHEEVEYLLFPNRHLGKMIPFMMKYFVIGAPILL